MKVRYHLYHSSIASFWQTNTSPHLLTNGVPRFAFTITQSTDDGIVTLPTEAMFQIAQRVAGRPERSVWELWFDNTTARGINIPDMLHKELDLGFCDITCLCLWSSSFNILLWWDWTYILDAYDWLTFLALYVCFLYRCRTLNPVSCSQLAEPQSGNTYIYTHAHINFLLP